MDRSKCSDSHAKPGLCKSTDNLMFLRQRMFFPRSPIYAQAVWGRQDRGPCAFVLVRPPGKPFATVVLEAGAVNCFLDSGWPMQGGDEALGRCEKLAEPPPALSAPVCDQL